MTPEKKERDFLKRLLETFRVEADEHLHALSAGLVALEQAPDAETREPIVETLFRETHSLKGAARSVNLLDVEALCQSLESAMAAMKQHKIPVTAPTLDLLHAAVDSIDQLLAVSLDGGSAKTDHAEAKRRLSALLEGNADHTGSTVSEKHSGTNAGASETSAGAVAPEREVAAETIRVSMKRLEALHRQAEELLPIRLGAGQRSIELRELLTEVAGWKRRWAEVRPLVNAFRRSPGKGEPDGLGRFIEFADLNESVLTSVEDRIARIARSAESDGKALSACVDGLLYGTRLTLMLPFSYLTDIVPKTVRDLSREQGKEIELVLRGTDIEIDRRLLQEMKDPLIHLLRNCIDHGVESPDERRNAGKPSQGTVTISVQRRNGSKVEIDVSDDGAGIDVLRVKASAVKQGIIPSDEAGVLNERDALTLIFQSGISTSPLITDISGRGLGLAIVREKVESLGGTVSVETQPGAGTTFHLVLPLTLSTFRGLLVRVGERKFVLPTGYVERVASFRAEELQSVANRKTVSLGGVAVSVVWLGEVLRISQMRSAEKSGNSFPVVILSANDRRMAFAVDEILADQEVLVKGLGPQLKRVWNIGGAALLGTGELVPVLNVPDLMMSAVNAADSVPLPEEGPEAEAVTRRSILVVEDSITARTLIKNILEGAGFDVTTAVDGVEGYATAREKPFVLVVSDVDMPRMNGFEFTAKIRADKRLCELPVVLVTALESRQDRERGIDVGANAYIVKSSFEQSNLLEVVNRLV